MAGIDRIIEKIISDAGARADGIKAAAGDEAQRNTRESTEQAAAECEAIIADARRAADNTEATSASSGERKYRQAVLAAKIDILDRALADLQAYFLGLPDDEYFNTVINIAAGIRLRSAALRRAAPF